MDQAKENLIKITHHSLVRVPDAVASAASRKFLFAISPNNPRTTLFPFPQFPFQSDQSQIKSGSRLQR